MLRFGQPVDPFGNVVDDEGRSLSPTGRPIDPATYVLHRGKPRIDAARDAAYTRELGDSLVTRYRAETVVMSTQLVAHVLYRRLVRSTEGVDLFARLRMRGEVSMGRADLLADVGETRDRLLGLAQEGAVHVSALLTDATPEQIVERALGAWTGYHSRFAALEQGAQVSIEDPTLLLYYQNRLVPWADHIAGETDSDGRTGDRRDGGASMSMKVGILGGGGFGRGLASAAARAGCEVHVVSRHPTERQAGDGPVHFTGRLADLADAEIIFLAVPSEHVASYARDVGEHLDGSHLLVHVSRGLVGDELRTLTDLLRAETPCRRVGALGGPLVADALAEGRPSGAVVGTRFPEVAEAVRHAIGGPTLRIYQTTDVRGVEVASAMVGLLALACGIAQGLGVGPATLAVMATRGMAEAARVGSCFGGEGATFFGLAGFGDLIAAIAGDERPEIRLGRAIARGVPMEEASREVGAYIEGVTIARRVATWAERTGIEVPITAVVADGVEGRIDAEEGIARLMTREVRSE